MTDEELIANYLGGGKKPLELLITRYLRIRAGQVKAKLIRLMPFPAEKFSATNTSATPSH